MKTKPMPDVLYRTYNALRWGQTVEDIRTMLLSTGLTEYQAWLTYMGAELIARKVWKDNSYYHKQ